jgi:hypothetical protein
MVTPFNDLSFTPVDPALVTPIECDLLVSQVGRLYAQCTTQHESDLIDAELRFFGSAFNVGNPMALEDWKVGWHEKELGHEMAKAVDNRANWFGVTNPPAVSHSRRIPAQAFQRAWRGMLDVRFNMVLIPTQHMRTGRPGPVIYNVRASVMKDGQHRDVTQLLFTVEANPGPSGSAVDRLVRGTCISSVWRVNFVFLDKVHSSAFAILPRRDDVFSAEYVPRGNLRTLPRGIEDLGVDRSYGADVTLTSQLVEKNPGPWADAIAASAAAVGPYLRNSVAVVTRTVGPAISQIIASHPQTSLAVVAAGLTVGPRLRKAVFATCAALFSNRENLIEGVISALISGTIVAGIMLYRRGAFSSMRFPRCHFLSRSNMDEIDRQAAVLGDNMDGLAPVMEVIRYATAATFTASHPVGTPLPPNIATPITSDSLMVATGPDPADFAAARRDMPAHAWCRRWAVRVRIEMNYPSNSVANRAIAGDKLREMWTTLNVRHSTINAAHPTALALVFVPTREECMAAVALRSAEVLDRTMEMKRQVLWFDWFVPKWFSANPSSN